jgi:N-acetylglucosaminyldiphosphoundecaprenol N-acetyl-beta-D-mannosaminyltransferase
VRERRSIAATSRLGNSRKVGGVDRSRRSGGAAARRVEVVGCPVDALDLEATVRQCIDLIQNGGGWQVSINAAKVVLCSREPELAAAIRTAHISSADGVPILWASRLLGEPLPGRVNGTDLMNELMQAGSDLGLRAFVLGSTDYVLRRAIERIRDLYPGLVIAGFHHGYFGAEREDEVIREIRDSRADLLFVAMSSPEKEYWLARNWERLGVGCAMGVGGSIDVLAGVHRRAPVWMQRHGLEWLFRLLIEPRRMWRRYLVGNLQFLWILGRELARRHLARWSQR